MAIENKLNKNAQYKSYASSVLKHGPAIRGLDATNFEYPGSDCWSEAHITGLMQYNAACRNPVGGTWGDVIIFSYEDFEVTQNLNSAVLAKWGEIYTVPTAPTSKPGIMMNLLSSGSEASFTLTRDDYGTHWEHSVILRFPQRSPSSKYFLDHCDHGAFCFVIANKDGGVLDIPDADPNTKHFCQIFECYGYNSGLVLTGISSSTALTNNHAYEITFQSQEKTGWELGPPITLFNAPDGDTSKEEAYYKATRDALKNWCNMNANYSSNDLIERLPEEFKNK